MPICSCGTHLEGRRRKCDPCKAANRTGEPVRRGRSPSHAARATRAESEPAADMEPTDEPEVETPDGLDARGCALWKSLGHNLDTPGGQLALEACRLADRLERLNSLLTGGDSWFEVVEEIPDSGQYAVTINKPLAEARQQQLAFRALLVELGATRVKGNPGYGGEHGTPVVPTPAVAKRTPLEEARERRRARGQA